MRLPSGGRIDRAVSWQATVDGRVVLGHPGDTVASALLAAGRITVAPSIYRRRPRGIVAAGWDEPNALLQLGGEPMLPATVVALTDGLSAETLSGVGRLTPADRTNGVHRSDKTPSDKTPSDKKYVHTDVLVVGGGPAGLMAALGASAGGARVLLVDDRPELGGALLAEPARPSVVTDAVRELTDRPEVGLVTSATAFSIETMGDSAYVLVAERSLRSEQFSTERSLRSEQFSTERRARDRLWHIRARRVVVATGAQERPMVFADNDRPGIMLAGAVREYVNRFGVLPGRDAVVFTADDSGYATALDLARAGALVGARVVALVDTRDDPPADLASAAAAAGITVLPDLAVAGTDADGEGRVRSVRLTDGRVLACDLLAVAGGWSPVAQLYSQAGGTLAWDDEQAAFLPVHPEVANLRVAGSSAGRDQLADCLADGAASGADAAREVGFPGPVPVSPPLARRVGTRTKPLWLVPGADGGPTDWHDHFVDLQRDATVADVWRAVGAGMRSAEHVKRYTTIGTGSDQGRTSQIPAAGLIATALGLSSPAALGTTTFRAPCAPVPFALLAGRDRGELHDPVRTTPIHSWHVEQGARFEDVGQWKRPWFYPLAGEDQDAAVARECRAARTGVAVLDASTLGKIDVVGTDSGEFLNRVYTNGFAKLAVGSARYGVLCGCDGMVFDDGVVARLAEHHFYLTTTTGNAASVLDWFEEWAQTEWPGLDVTFTSVTEQWATMALVGPRSRAVLTELAPELDCGRDGFGFMTVRETVLRSGVPARIARVSFSGELAFEINVASWYGLSTWQDVMAAGAAYGITPYGTEAMHVLRAEKGFPIVGQDTDGTVTPHDLGMSWIVSTRKDFLGRRSLLRPDSSRPDRKQLVGLLPVERDELLPEGAQLVAPGVPVTPGTAPVPVPMPMPMPMLGHVTSSYRSSTLGRTFALALVRGGRDRLGERVVAPLGNRSIEATITEPVFYDPEGARRDG
ncbi:MAG TPA: 2Fe-2S iron-sulfur cluster-binding protein [Pseudonocardia sp.]|nr:2Fe-2S iron-sulfur cluster-binding protein [Pseudonocardia sp.]